MLFGYYVLVFQTSAPYRTHSHLRPVVQLNSVRNVELAGVAPQLGWYPGRLVRCPGSTGGLNTTRKQITSKSQLSAREAAAEGGR